MKTDNKTYDKVQYTGNENHWAEPTKVLSKHSMNAAKADELNQYFGSSGIKYVESDGKPYDGEVPEGYDHGEANLIAKDGKLVPTDDKAKAKADAENREVTDTVKSNGEIIDKEAEVDPHSSVQFAPKVGTEQPEPEKREDAEEKK